MKRALLTGTASLVVFAAIALARVPSPAGAEVYIISPEDGAVVSGPVRVVFGLRGMGIAPAGVERSGTGHHHLLIDRELPAFDKPIPADEHTIHLGGGQTETELELAPGEHNLQLLLADHTHTPHDPPVYSKKINITVVE